MAVNVNREEQSLSLLLAQYKDSDELRKFITVFAIALNEIQQQILNLWIFRSLDRAFGVQLDVIGEILGYDRPFVIINNDDIFTFENSSDVGKGFGSYLNPNLGGRFLGVGFNNNFIKLSDAEYKQRLRAKIIKNSSKGTLKDIINYLKLTYNQDPILTIGIGYIDVEFPNFIPSYEIAFLRDNMPVAAGIKVRNITISS